MKPVKPVKRLPRKRHVVAHPEPTGGALTREVAKLRQETAAEREYTIVFMPVQFSRPNLGRITTEPAEVAEVDDQPDIVPDVPDAEPELAQAPAKWIEPTPFGSPGRALNYTAAVQMRQTSGLPLMRCAACGVEHCPDQAVHEAAMKPPTVVVTGPQDPTKPSGADPSTWFRR